MLNHWELSLRTEPKELSNDVVTFKIVKEDGTDFDPTSVTSGQRLACKINERLERFGQALPENAQQRERIESQNKILRARLAKLAKSLCNLESERDENEGYEQDIVDLQISYGKFIGKYEGEVGRIRAYHYANFDSEEKPTEVRIPQSSGLSETQQSVAADIERTAHVVHAVLQRRENSRNSVQRTALTNLLDGSSGRSTASDDRLSYFARLRDIATLAINGDAEAVFAAEKLVLFKRAFVEREAGFVKNSHIRMLGVRALIAGTVLLICFAATKFMLDAYLPSDYVRTLVSFLLLGVGASGGTWLSFSLRKVNLRFDDLVLLETDHVDPFNRLIFVIGLTCIVGLLMELRWVGVAISGNALIPSQEPLAALLLGILCGIAERSLSGIVSGKAEDLVGSIGAKVPVSEDR